MKKLDTEDLLRMCIPKRYWHSKQSDITSKSNNENDVQPQQLIRNYITKSKDMMDKGVGLLLWGPNGRGKTSIAVVLAKHFRMNQNTVLFFETAELRASIIEKRAFDEKASIWQRAKSCDVLILDDLGKGATDSTGFGLRMIDELLRHRNAWKKITIITTNMTPKSLLEELKISTLHSMKECLFPVKIDGIDRREQAKEEIKSILMSR